MINREGSWTSPPEIEGYRIDAAEVVVQDLVPPAGGAFLRQEGDEIHIVETHYREIVWHDKSCGVCRLQGKQGRQIIHGKKRCRRLWLLEALGNGKHLLACTSAAVLMEGILLATFLGARFNAPGVLWGIPGFQKGVSISSKPISDGRQFQ